MNVEIGPEIRAAILLDHRSVNLGPWILSLLLLLLYPSIQYGQDGQLDPTFAENGVLILDSNAFTTSLNSLVIDADGNYLGTGSRSGQTFVRYLTRISDQGVLDGSFGVNGSVIEQITFGNDYANDALLQPDGKIVVFGSADSALCISRFHSDGSLDQTFGNSGRTLVSGTEGIAQGFGITMRPNGEFITCGMLNNDLCVAQFTPTGELDLSFGGNGIVTIVSPTELDRFESLAVRPDGRLLAVGRTGDWNSSHVVVAQFTTTGVLDNSFATLGQLHLDFTPSDDTAEDVVLLADGSAVLCGRSSYQGYIARITDSGALDPGFGNGGITTIVLGGDSVVPFTGLAVQSDGKYVCSGSLSLFGIGQLAIVRFDNNGMRDASFGSNGVVIADIGSPYGETTNDVAITPEGSILVCGNANMGATTNALFARFISGLETGVNEVYADPFDMDIYPNPTDGTVMIDLRSATPLWNKFEVIDSQGRAYGLSVFRTRTTSDHTTQQIDLSLFANGLYILRYCTDLGCVSRPVVINTDQ